MGFLTSSSFQAHKFPYTPSVYYQCNVRLCIKHAGGCEDTPPVCGSGANGNALRRRRRKRQIIEANEERGFLYDDDRDDVRIEVHSGLYVQEAGDLDTARDFIDDPEDEFVRTLLCFFFNHIGTVRTT